MGRPLRIEYPDAFYHITARGNERQNIFKSNRDRERFLGYLRVRMGSALDIGLHVLCQGLTPIVTPIVYVKG